MGVVTTYRHGYKGPNNETLEIREAISVGVDGVFSMGVPPFLDSVVEEPKNRPGIELSRHE